MRNPGRGCLDKVEDFASSIDDRPGAGNDRLSRGPVDLSAEVSSIVWMTGMRQSTRSRPVIRRDVRMIRYEVGKAEDVVPVALLGEEQLPIGRKILIFGVAGHERVEVG